jgi:hypothetical protein
MGGCEDKTLACEAEDSPLLDSIVMEWLMKTQQAIKGLAGAVIFKVWRLVIVL